MPSLKLSLSKKFVLLLLGFVLPMIIAGNLFFFKQNQLMLIKQVNTSTNNILNFIQEFITREQTHISNTVKLVAADPVLSLAIAKDKNSAFTEQFERVTNIYSEVNYMLLLDENKQILSSRSPATELNPDDVNLSKINIDKHPLFTRWLEKQGAMSPPGHDPLLQKFGLKDKISQWFIAPILHQGQMSGWVVISYPWQDTISRLNHVLTNRLTAMGIPVMGIAILNEEGKLFAGKLAKPNESLINLTEFFSIHEKQFILHIQLDRSWTLQGLALQKELLFTLALPLFTLLLITFYLIVKYQLLQPIRNLNKATAKFAHGDLSYRLDTKGEDELATLSANLNEMAKKLALSQDQLENEVEKRTEALNNSNKELAKSIIEANDAAVAKSEFLSRISHEIRTPLNGVLGMINLLRRGNLDDKQKHYAKLAHHSSESLLSIINDILDFSKIETGDIELEILPFEPRSYFGDFIKSMAARNQKKNIELILNMKDLPNRLIRTDPSRIRQILTNIIDNALIHTHEGEITVEIQLQSEGTKVSTPQYCSIKNGEEFLLCFTVSDTGDGFPSDKTSDLFDAFTNTRGLLKPDNGAGLGLAIANKLCFLMGGDGISVYSKPGKGNEFSFEIKVKLCEESAFELPTNFIQGKTILIADENKKSRDAICEQLQYWGVNTIATQDASETLETLKNTPSIDAGFLNAKLKQNSGIELCQAIRQTPGFEQLPMVLMTSTGEINDTQLFADAGFCAYFSKPITTTDLNTALSIALKLEQNDEHNALANSTHKINCLQYRLDKNPHKQNKQVLLVEDNVINQEVAVDLLKDLGYSAIKANNGLEALETLQNSEDGFDLILMDCQMPGMDGFAATKAIRSGHAGSKHKDIPIVALTADALEGDKDKCLEAGMDNYLAKPVNFNQLNDMLRLIFARQDVQKEQEPTISPNAFSHLSEIVKPNDELSSETLSSETIHSKTDGNSDSAIWDQNSLLETLQYKHERVKRLAELFIKTKDDTYSAIQSAMEAENQEETLNQIHGLKGACGNLKATELFELSKQLESAVKQDGLQELRPKWEQFDTCFNRLVNSLETFLDGQTKQ